MTDKISHQTTTKTFIRVFLKTTNLRQKKSKKLSVIINKSVGHEMWRLYRL